MVQIFWRYWMKNWNMCVHVATKYNFAKLLIFLIDEYDNTNEIVQKCLSHQYKWKQNAIQICNGLFWTYLRITTLFFQCVLCKPSYLCTSTTWHYVSLVLFASAYCFMYLPVLNILDILPTLPAVYLFILEPNVI